MLAQAEMLVVFVPDEIISLGSAPCALTAEKRPVSFRIWSDYLESATVTKLE